MTLLDALISALDALRLHKLRSALTMLGIVIGVAAVIAMVAVGGGAREQVVAQIRSLGANLLVISPGNVTQSGVRLGAGQAATLTDEDAAAIMKEVASVQVTAPYIRGSNVQIVAGGANWATTVYGVDLGWFEAREWEVEHGRVFEPEEISRGAQVALVGQTVARTLFGGLDPVGEELRVRNVPVRVIGVMAKKGQSTWGSDQDDVIFVPLPGVRRVLGRNQANARSVGSIYVKVREGESLANAETEVKALLRQRHRLQDQQEDDFAIRNLEDIAAAREASASTLAWLLAAVAGVSLAVGGIGIMNIMLVSVTERTREIGLRMAVGARQRDVLRQFLFEATGLSVIGGAVGVLAGMGAAYAIAQAAKWPLLIEPHSIVVAVVFSGLVGLFFGWYPALRAALLDPIQALRHT
jgi:putative ABC transport system permease protein